MPTKSSPFIRTVLLCVGVVAGCDRTPGTTQAPAPPNASVASNAVKASTAPNPSSTPQDDPYDQAQMDYKPGPATLGGDRHTGPFAAGSALSMDAAVKPLAAGAVKEVRLDTTHKVISFGLEANGSPGRAIEAFRRALADPAANMKMLRVVREGKLLEAQ